MKTRKRLFAALCCFALPVFMQPALSQAEAVESVECDSCQHGYRQANVTCIRFFYKLENGNTAIVFSGDRKKCKVSDGNDCIGETACQ